MNCRGAQSNLSLYLYGELSFSEEEALEQHLEGCAACRLMLEREKNWHGAANGNAADAAPDLLAECRRDLSSALRRRPPAPPPSRWLSWLDLPTPAWSTRLAAASFLFFIGFGAARYIDRNGLPGGLGIAINDMSVAGFSGARVREIQPVSNGVRIVYDQVRRREIAGSLQDAAIRQLLLSATEQPDPAVRVDSLQALDGQPGRDVRDALLNTVRHDANAAVRMKAVEGLRQFRDDPATREALVFVLQHDQNAAVRGQAIDVLAPAGQQPKSVDAGLAEALQTVVRSGQPDDYVRMRCFELLRDADTTVVVY